MPAEKKRLLTSAQIVLLLVLVTNSPIVFASLNPMDDSRVDTIIWEVIGLPEYMDPHKTYESAGWWVHANIYETLFTYDFESADTTPSVPLLTESVDISSDGLNYTFSLRQNIRFHDNTEFNATCVQMNFWRMLGRGWDDGFGPAWMIAEPILGGQSIEDAVYEHRDRSPQHIGNWTKWMENSDAIIVLDEFTVRIRLAYPYSPFLAVLANSVASMVSPTFFMAHGGMSPESNDLTLHEEACGTGPYLLDEWIQDDSLTIVLNDNYWRFEDARITHPLAGSITEVTWKLNPDSNSRLLNLHAGCIDGCDSSTSNAYEIWNNVTDRGDGTLQSIHPDIKLWTGSPNYNLAFLGFNMRPYTNISGILVQNPFANFELRAALSYAFDYESLIDDVSNGIATPLKGPVPTGMFAHDEDLNIPTRDMAEAVEHWNLAMASGLDTILANNSYTINLYYNEGGLTRRNIALKIKQAFEDIIADAASIDPSSPLSVNVTAILWSTYLYLIREPRPQLPIFFLGWAPDYADPHSYVEPFIRSTSTFPRRIGLENSTGEVGDRWID